MAPLEASSQYGLSSQDHSNNNNSLIFVKLTDSAARNIEDYLQNIDKLNQKPTIQFLGNEGHLFIPSSKSNNEKFTFSLSNEEDTEGTQGGFECIQETGPEEMESLGELLYKMRVHANDDTFETTRSRMQAVEVSNKNKCTRVLKPNETVNKKVKVKGTTRKSLPLSAQNHNNSLNNHALKRFSSSSLTLTEMPVHQPPIYEKSSEIMRRPLRKRLIHLLALRPFKMSELYDRMKNEGIKEQEKKLIPTILKQISNVQGNKTYFLHTRMWNEVQDDWPFYTEEERAMLKRRMPMTLTSPSCSETSSSGSSVIAPSISAMSAKRMGSEPSAYTLPQPKRQRISHYGRLEMNFVAASQEDSRSSWPDSVTNHHEDEQSPVKNQDFSIEFEDVADGQLEDSNNTGDWSIPDYTQTYTKIYSDEQRTRYKADFLTDYEEHQRLHRQVSESAERFMKWERAWEYRNRDNIEAEEKLQQKVVEEYNKDKTVRIRFNYLHKKLDHIKNLVAEYDEKMREQREE